MNRQNNDGRTMNSDSVSCVNQGWVDYKFFVVHYTYSISKKCSQLQVLLLLNTLLLAAATT